VSSRTSRCGVLALVTLGILLPGCKQNDSAIGREGATSSSSASSFSSASSLPSTTTGTAAIATTKSEELTPRKVRLVPAPADSEAIALIRTKRLEAKADKRVLVVYVSATWCEPCKKFKAELESGRLDQRLGSVTLLAFDADKDVDRLGSAGYAFRFVPFVALPGADGHPADSQEARGKGAQAWQELLGKLDSWQAQL
jgi:thiol-disulfide isomerase/thioredoxin